MSSGSTNLRGILAMIAATGFFVANDTFMKVVAEDLPPFQTLCMRGIVGSLVCLGLVLALGHGRRIGEAVRPRVVARGVAEVVGVLCYIVALAKMAIADVVAIGQTAPLLILLAAAVIGRERIGPLRLFLVALGFAGGLLVAQPDAGGFSTYALLAFATAVFVAVRDFVGRAIPADTPGFVVALSTTTIVMLAALTASMLSETAVLPTARHWLMIICSGVLVAFGQASIFLAYRDGRTASVAPFYYTFMIWAVLAGFFVWGLLPNRYSLAGMALILVSGIAVLLLEQRRLRSNLARGDAVSTT